MIRCPKCHAEGSNIEFAETWIATHWYTQDDDGVIARCDSPIDGPSPEKVTGHCKRCAYQWWRHAFDFWLRKGSGGLETPESVNPGVTKP